MARIAHIQLADNPGPQRAGHRRDQLSLPVRPASTAIGYAGWIGCEYKPKATTVDGPRLARRVPDELNDHDQTRETRA